ncbi:MAG: pyruvate kinase, partial [Acidobacteria bacterium]|nr:pyruvate kinase [Acidobacteriota bacterium]
WPDGPHRITQAITHAASLAADDAAASAIVCCTQGGNTARAMARFRPAAALIGVSPHGATLRRLALSWGVTPVLMDDFGTVDELVWHAVERCVHEGLVEHGQTVLVLAGAPDRSSGASTDVLRIVRIS